MSASAPPSDPVTEIDALSSGLASLDNQLSRGEITQEQYNASSKELRDRLASAESLAYSLARKNENVAKRLRARSYTLPLVQQICNHFTYGSNQPLEPEFGADRVPRYYVEPEGGDGIEIDGTLLERLSDIGVLVASLYEKVLFCPKCGTPSRVYARFKCTQCDSIDIAINRMIEHLQCGTIHQEREFHAGNNVVCPSCKKMIQNPDEQRLIGLVCSCNKCGAHFEDPAQSFFCRKCELDFNLATGVLTNVHIYTLNDKVSQEIRAYLGVPAVARILKNNGFEVSAPGVLIGDSRESQFSIVAKQGPKTVAIEISLSSDEVDVEPVLAMYVKLLETKPEIAILGAIPRLSQRARNVASKHGILFAEGMTPEEIAPRILEIATSSSSLPSQEVR